jgi:hypothetical protein
MIALAVVMIAVAALGAAGPVSASVYPVYTCEDLSFYIDYCADALLPGNPLGYQGCLSAVYAGADYNGLDVKTCFQNCGEDGRINQNCSAPEIAYCDEEEIDFYYYNYFTGNGEYDFSVDMSNLMQSVKVKTLIKQDGAIKIYLNPDGTVLMLAPQTDGKIYYMSFDPQMCVPLGEGAEWGLH